MERLGSGRWTIVDHADAKLGEQIDDDTVVISGVERDLVLSPGFSQRPHDVERVVAVEGRDFRCYDLGNLKERAPELVVQDDTADRGLKIKTKDRNDFGNDATVRDELGVRRVFQCREAQKPGVVAKSPREFSFTACLSSIAANPGDEHGRSRVSACDVGADGEDRFEKADGWIPNRKLSGVNADGQPPAPAAR